MPTASAWIHPPSNGLRWVGPVDIVYGYSQGWGAGSRLGAVGFVCGRGASFVDRGVVAMVV